MLASYNGLAIAQNLSHALHVFKVYWNYMSRAMLYNLPSYYNTLRAADEFSGAISEGGMGIGLSGGIVYGK